MVRVADESLRVCRPHRTAPKFISMAYNLQEQTEIPLCPVGVLPLRAGGTDLVVQKVCVSEKGPSPASLMACILKL